MPKELRVFLEAVAVDALLFTAGFFLFVEEGDSGTSALIVFIISSFLTSLYLAVRTPRPAFGSALPSLLCPGAILGVTVAVVLTAGTCVSYATAPEATEGPNNVGAGVLFIVAWMLMAPGYAVSTVAFGLIFSRLAKDR